MYITDKKSGLKMRITQNYSIQSILDRINNTRSRIYQLQSNLATGRRVNKISDDPEKIDTLLRYKNALKTNQLYQRNIENALEFMAWTSQALDDALNIVSSAKEIALKAGNILNDEEWSALSGQINQLLKELVDIGNTRFKDRYVFGGSYPSQQPFVLSSDESQVIVNPQGVGGKLRVEYGKSQIDTYNVSGEEAFLKDVNIFQTLIDLRNAFVNKDTNTVLGLMDKIDQSLNQLATTNGNLGAKMNRFDVYLQQYQTLEIKLQEYQSKIEDTDVAKAISDLQMAETGLTTALQVLARTLNISLVDFMK